MTTKDKPAPKLRGHQQMLTASLPDLVANVDARAAKERRSRANMVEAMLQENFDRGSVELARLDEKRV